MGKSTILVIEDEPDIAEVVQYNLERDGFRVVTSRHGQEGLDRARREAPDLLLLDLMLPGIDGLDICRRLKEDPDSRSIPIVIMTAKGEESDVVLGLGLGADDYVTKPFSPKELVARVRAVLRRAPVREDATAAGRIELGPVVLDIDRHQVTIGGEPVSFTATELRLFHYLASRPGRVFTRDQLIAKAVGHHAVVIGRNIDVHIRSIRSKLGDHRELIETVRGVGYRVRER